MLKKVITSLLSISFLLCGNLPDSILEPKEAEASAYNDLAERPFMGWSSWSSIRKHPTEQKIKDAADIMAAKFKQHGYQYVNLDDYYMLDWTTTVDQYGRWAVDPKKFPNGMKAVGDYIHSKGLRFGLYVTLGIPKGAVDHNTPIQGTPYHAKDIVDFRKGQKVNFNFENMYSIDYSKPGAQEYIDSWANLFASYGVDYLKIDGVRNQDIADVEAWANALKKTGRSIHVELSNNLDIKHSSTWQQLSNGWRTDHDVESYGKPTLTDWEHVYRRFSDAAQWQPHAGPGGWNDFDSLNVANGSKDGLTNEEKRSYVSLWAIAASHFVIGNDLTKLDDFGIALLTNDEILAANQSGKAGKRLSNKFGIQVFYQTLPDGSYNIGLFNTDKTVKEVSVNWSDIGIDGTAKVRDMWSHQDLGTKYTNFTASLPAHGSRMLHVIPASSITVEPKSGATGVNPSHVELKWNSASDAGGYHLLVARDPDFKNIIIDHTVPSEATNIESLEPDSRYYWKVSAITGKTESPIGTYSFYTKMTTTPEVPDWILADRNNEDSVTITWNPSFGTDFYTIYRKKVNIFGVSSDYKPIATNVNEPYFIDKTAPLENGSRYVYRVSAHNAIGKSLMSQDGNVDRPSPVQTLLPYLVLLLTLIVLVSIYFINKRKNKISKSV
ncbi:alpha-galactosidase [Neobacillus dielmonensis]|uniref:alpha-galactosidase n=1 Tax=Neobacillus dielmonensis TaxID=1347369 RepID=UPI0006948848|nr:alpha-galactosidase [Neobacillus dielmonensis]